MNVKLFIYLRVLIGIKSVGIGITFDFIPLTQSVIHYLVHLGTIAVWLAGQGWG